MSLQDQQNAIILENVPKLIQNLTEFSEDDDNFSICENFVISRIRNHKYLTVNSHEIRRQIDALAERFHIANNENAERHLRELCDKIIKHPVCEDHIETDIEWSILDFLFSMAFNPVNSSKTQIGIGNESKSDDSAEEIRLKRDQKTYWTKLLQTDNIAESFSSDSDSNLSVWTDSENDEETETPNNENSIQVHTANDEIVKSNGIFANFKEPQKSPHFYLFNGSASLQWLNENIQNSWWKDQHSIHRVDSVHRSANFCHDVENFAHVSTTSEYCLIREIIWMFTIPPATCKFFKLGNDQISLNKLQNASLNSTSLKGLQQYLENICYYMTLKRKLEKFCNDICKAVKIIPSPVAYECFADGIKQCLKPFNQYLVQTEMEIMQKTPLRRTTTILEFLNEMQTHLNRLENIYHIYEKSILNYELIPAHICTSHMMTNLLNESSSSSNTNYSNLAASLFLICARVYLHIIDIWWTEGRLEDMKQEFLIEKSEDLNDEKNSDGFKIRNFEIVENPNSIQNNSFIKLITDRSMQAGYSLNILYNLDRIGDIKSRPGYEENLYETFLDLVTKKLLNFKINCTSNEIQCENETNDDEKSETRSNSSDVDENVHQLIEFRNELQNENELLLMAFEDSISSMLHQLKNACTSHTQESEKSSYNSYEIFESLNVIAPIILPFEQTVLEVLNQLLESRIYLANSCAMKIYKNEFDILQNVRNIRKVYLLEESDLMHTFYSNLFKQIENGENWNNPFLLTVQLNGILCSKYPATNSLFTIQVYSRNYKEADVLDAIKGISINYTANEGIRDIVDERCFSKYNEVFRYLLKIKWALWTLENMRFPKSMKKRRPYTLQNMTDLIFKRLALVRNWIIYAIQCIHNHLMTQVLQSMGQQLDQKIQHTKNLNEMIDVHLSYINTVYDHCFQTENDYKFRSAIDQFLILIIALKDEWHDICYIKDDMDDDFGSDELDSVGISSQIDAIEQTYINCHRVIAAILSSEVYTKDRNHLSGLSAAFNCSHPF